MVVSIQQVTFVLDFVSRLTYDNNVLFVDPGLDVMAFYVHGIVLARYYLRIGSY